MIGLPVLSIIIILIPMVIIPAWIMSLVVIGIHGMGIRGLVSFSRILICVVTCIACRNRLKILRTVLWKISFSPFFI